MWRTTFKILSPQPPLLFKNVKHVFQFVHTLTMIQFVHTHVWMYVRLHVFACCGHILCICLRMRKYVRRWVRMNSKTTVCVHDCMFMCAAVCLIESKCEYVYVFFLCEFLGYKSAKAKPRRIKLSGADPSKSKAHRIKTQLGTWYLLCCLTKSTKIFEQPDRAHPKMLLRVWFSRL